MKNKEITIVERIEAAMLGRQVLMGEKVTWSSLAKSIGYTPQAPTNWKKGNISYKVIQKIADYLGADPSWLMYGSLHENIILSTTGIGKSALTNPHTNGFDPNFNISEVDTRLSEKCKNIYAMLPEDFSSDSEPAGYHKEHIVPVSKAKELGQDININNNIAYINKYLNMKMGDKNTVKLVPLISYVQAGSFKEAILNAQENFVACYAENLGENTFALEIQGESMMPEFKPGDKIIVDPDVQPIPGDYVIAQNGEHEATFKKYRPRGYDANGEVIFELAPLNPDYPVLNSAEQPIRVIGTVVEHIRALRRRRV